MFDIASNIWFLYLNLVPRTHIDDEYANAAERDPKILLTTSRNPSAPLTQFVKVGAEFDYLIGFCCLSVLCTCLFSYFWTSIVFKWNIFLFQELKFVFPNAQRMNRGGQVGFFLISIHFYFCYAFDGVTVQPSVYMPG